MPRPVRIEYENAWHHVMNRGGARRDVFISEAERELFLDLLARVTERYQIEIHAYCLMDNHFHLLVKTPFANISATLQYLLSNYTLRFNRMHRLDGPLFRGRFKSLIVGDESYLLEISRYIHLNPIKAKLVSHPATYLWSSYAAFIGRRERQSWLHIDDTLQRFGLKNHSESYQQFVEKPTQMTLDKFYSQRRLPSVLGGNFFRKHVILKLAEQASRITNVYDKNLVNRTIMETALHFQVVPENITQGKRGVKNTARLICLYICGQRFRQNISSLAKHFGVGKSTISESVTGITNRLQKDVVLSEHVDTICQKLALN